LVLIWSATIVQCVLSRSLSLLGRSQLVLDRTNFQLFCVGGFEYFWDLDVVFHEGSNQSCPGHFVEVFPQLLTINLLLRLFF